MAAGINKVILIGNLGNDPELKYGQQSGKAVCRFSLATTERWNGEDRTEWHRIVCFGRTAEIANEYLAKGRQVFVEGRISYSKYQGNDGQERYSTDILVNNLTLLGGRREGGDYAPPREPRSVGAAPSSAPGQQQERSFQQAPREQSPMADDPFSGDYGPMANEDDIPF